MAETISAGTYVYTDCVVCPGTPATYTSVEPPHPIYLSQTGDTQVVQIQAVEIGGFNGLNN